MGRAPRRLAALASVAVGLLGTPARGADPVPGEVAIPPILHLPEALELFRARGLDLLIADAAVRAAEGDEAAAGAIANPSLSAAYGRSRYGKGCTDGAGNPEGCPWLPDALWSFGLSDQASIENALSGKRGLRVEVARRALEAARASRADAQRTLEAQVKQQFLQVLVAGEALRFAAEVAGAGARTLELTRHRYEAGAITEADLARIEVTSLEAEQARDVAEQGLRDARAGLAFLLGVRRAAPTFEVEGPEFLRHSEPPGLRDASPDAVLARAREHRPDLEAALAQRERAAAAAALARRLRFPDVSLQVGYSQQGTTPAGVNPPTWTAGLSFALPVLYQQQGEIQKAEAERSAGALAAARVEAQVAQDVDAGLADYRASGSLVRRMEGGLLARAQRARDLVEIQYRKGAGTLLDFLDAQRTYIAVRVEYLQALLAYWGAVFRLEQATGESLR